MFTVCQEIALKGAPVSYKSHIGIGNNSQAVRSLFKNRWWWLLHDKEDITKVNFNGPSSVKMRLQSS